MNNKRNPSALQRADHSKRDPPREQMLVVRLSEDEMRRLDEKSKRIGANRSELARAAIFRCKIRDLSPEALELRKSFIRACGNLNQFMHHLNIYGHDESVEQRVREIIDWLHQQRDAGIIL